MESTSDFSFAVQLDAKEWAVLVPTVASGLAITYELGSFLPLGTRAFGLFSLSDHLLWALQALPYSVFLVGIALIALIYSAYFRRKRAAHSPFQRHRPRWPSLAFSILFGSSWLTFGIMLRSATIITMAVASLVIAVIPASDAGRRSVKVIAALTILALAFCLGADATRRFLNHGRPAEFQMSNGEVKTSRPLRR
jgi:hypothetical protein